MKKTKFLGKKFKKVKVPGKKLPGSPKPKMTVKKPEGYYKAYKKRSKEVLTVKKK